jgi:hypothetical protein
MERMDVGKGRFLITHSREELQQYNRCIKISNHLALAAVLASHRESAVGPGEIQGINNDIKKHVEIVDSLMKGR